ncbi:ComEA family DNA-binding protein [Kibdelosporangium persicum]|uniref:Competence protein ComEA helix-hairpin-helix region n=1 Tax=Kibdelosporangium persicum TaxID=2698649 RepID=A0ABX2F722_9PSEU|nr:ComEA family DNA-binding protein [Kibdelosporangium persicum]NRN66755.1 Competence protein ComEA helix-hairpin-helix region [Kibdelosporangium persicum]
MFETLRRKTADDKDPRTRLRELATASTVTVPEHTEEWIDETPPEPVARPRLKNLRLPVVVTATVVIAACATIGILVAQPDKEVPPPLPAAVVTTNTSTATGRIVVSVVGRVPRPGLVTLPEGARVADAVHAAGGASDLDTLALNMARRLSDGEQIYVGIPPPPEAAPAPQSKPAKIDLNTATAAQLDSLPGVGAVTAQRIIDWRTERGPFTAVDQLRNIDGIGETRYSRLKDLVTVR